MISASFILFIFLLLVWSEPSLSDWYEQWTETLNPIQVVFSFFCLFLQFVNEKKNIEIELHFDQT